MTIQELRQKGFKIYVQHSRLIKIDGKSTLISMKQIRDEKMQNLILSKGGITTIDLIDKDGKEYVAYARCSKHDSFNRKLANKIALGRLLTQIAPE